MAPYERGSADRDDVRVFDGGEDEDDTEGSSLPVVIVICLLVLAAFGGVVWLAYNQGVARGRGDEPSHAVTQIAANETPATAPDSNDSAPKTIKVYQQPAGPDDTADTDTPPAQETATAPPAQLAPAPLTKVAPSKPAPVQSAPVQNEPVHSEPVAQTPPAPEKPVPVENKPVTVAKTEAPKPKPEAAPAVSETPVTAPAGAYVLQIGAYKSVADAETAWKQYASKHADLIAGASHDVQKADLGDKGVWFRLRAGSYADKASAADMCDKLKAEGGACFPAK
jgi:cell division protein FtsN